MKIVIHIRFLVAIGFVGFFAGCSEDLLLDAGQMVEEPRFSTVSGTIMDAKSGRPVPGALVTILDRRLESAADGRFIFSPINQSNVLTLIAEALDYTTEIRTFSARTEDVTVDVLLAPLTNPEAELREFLNTFSKFMQTMNVDDVKQIEGLFTEEFLASDDLVTRFFGIDTGVIPINFKSVIPTVITLFEEYSLVQFRFQIVQMNITNTRKAFAQLEIDVFTEKGFLPHRREIISVCEVHFRKQASKWKIFFWKFAQADIRL